MITYHSTGNRDRFVSRHTVHYKTGDGRELYIHTGIVIVDIEGRSDWRREDLQLIVSYEHSLPPGKVLRVEEWTVFLAPMAIFNQNVANNAGWAVDEFGLVSARETQQSFILQARVAVRDTDGWLHRVGYQVTLVGKYADFTP